MSIIQEDGDEIRLAPITSIANKQTWHSMQEGKETTCFLCGSVYNSEAYIHIDVFFYVIHTNKD